MRWISSPSSHFCNTEKEFFLSHFFLLCFVVGKHASHSLEETEDIEKGNVFSCKKKTEKTAYSKRKWHQGQITKQSNQLLLQ